jgi:hypothetical protein
MPSKGKLNEETSSAFHIAGITVYVLHNLTHLRVEVKNATAWEQLGR